ncbi:MAG: hypothetical protein AAGA68_02470 [Pseudomonadota bacterium]
MKRALVRRYLFVGVTVIAMAILLPLPASSSDSAVLPGNLKLPDYLMLEQLEAALVDLQVPYGIEGQTVRYRKEDEARILRIIATVDRDLASDTRRFRVVSGLIEARSVLKLLDAANVDAVIDVCSDGRSRVVWATADIEAAREVIGKQVVAESSRRMPFCQTPSSVLDPVSAGIRKRQGDR